MSKLSITPKGTLVSICSQSRFLSPAPKQPLFCFLSLIDWPFPENSHKRNLTTCGLLCLASSAQHSIIGALQPCTTCPTPLLLIAAEYFSVRAYCIFCLQSPVDRHLDFSQFGTIMNKPAVDILIHVFLYGRICSFLLGRCLRVGLQGHMASLCLTFSKLPNYLQHHYLSLMKTVSHRHFSTCLISVCVQKGRELSKCLKKIFWRVNDCNAKVSLCVHITDSENFELPSYQ